MASVEWLMLCEHAEIKDGKLHIAGIVETIFSDTFPLKLDHLYLVARFLGEPHERVPFTVFMSQRGKKLDETKPNIPLELNPNGERLVHLDMVNLLIPRPGTYEFEIQSGDETLFHTRYSFIEARATAH